MPPLTLATGPARHLISIFEIAVKDHAPLGSDLISPVGS